MRNSGRPGKRWRTSGPRCPTEMRVVIVCGEGPSFSAGLDRSAFSTSPDSLLGAIATAPNTVADETIAGFQRGFSWLGDPRFVSIAAVAGHAVGAGFQLALACDLIVVADDAEFRMAEVSYGLVPDLGGTARLLQLVGYQRALEICATGRHVSAAEAVRIGLALVSVPLAELDAAVADLAAALVESPAPAVAGHQERCCWPPSTQFRRRTTGRRTGRPDSADHGVGPGRHGPDRATFASSTGHRRRLARSGSSAISPANSRSAITGDPTSG